MTTVVQVIIRVILGVKGFIAARPGLPAGIRTAAAALLAKVDAMRALGQAQGDGQVRSKKAVTREEELRRYIWIFIIQPLGFIAADAFAGQPSKALEFRMTYALTRAKERFLAQGRAILQATRASEARLLEFGMDPGLPALLEAQLEEYAALPEAVTDGRRTRFGATDQLDTATKQALTTLRRLDGLMRHHFRDDPATLAEWATIRNVPWPGSGKAKADGAGDSAGTPPAGGPGTGTDA